MIGIVIVAHGGLAREYLSAVEHVVGRQDGVRAISIEDDHDRSAKQAEICAAADAVDTGQGVVLVTDMFGGSPSNLSLPACAASGRRILYGANLPMLIKLAKSRDLAVPEAVAAATYRGYRWHRSVIVPGVTAKLLRLMLAVVPHGLVIPAIAWLLFPRNGDPRGAATASISDAKK